MKKFISILSLLLAFTCIAAPPPPVSVSGSLVWTNHPGYGIYPLDKGGNPFPTVTTNRVIFDSKYPVVPGNGLIFLSGGGSAALAAFNSVFSSNNIAPGQVAGLMGVGTSGQYLNYGVIGETAPKWLAGGTNVGVAGMAVPFGSDGVYVGGFFGVSANAPADINYESTALLVDTYEMGGPIVTTRTNNGTIMFQQRAAGDFDLKVGTYYGNGLGLSNVTAIVTNFTTYASGTAYTLTGSSDALDFGTTDPVLTINQTGTYLIQGNVGILYSGATYAGAQTITLKFRRTNNTAADLTNGSRAVELPVLTTFTGGDVMTLPPVIYTATSGDTVTIFGILSATPAAGSVQATSAEIVAIRLY